LADLNVTKSMQLIRRKMNTQNKYIIQINLVSLPLINFRKFINGDEK